MSRQIANHSININGVGIFYREAGDRENPSVLLLHGYPSSSVMFKNLMIALSDRFYLVAPDYPGFGCSGFPAPGYFEYTFGNISTCINAFTDAIGLKTFTIYLHDYGCPIGLRLCLAHPEKIEKIIVQNGNAYSEGIGPQWDETIDYWQNPTPEKESKGFCLYKRRRYKGAICCRAAGGASAKSQSRIVDARLGAPKKTGQYRHAV